MPCLPMESRMTMSTMYHVHKKYRELIEIPRVCICVQIISDHLIGGGTSFNAPGAAGFQRPLVVVMHRAMDLVSMLRHNR